MTTKELDSLTKDVMDASDLVQKKALKMIARASKAAGTIDEERRLDCALVLRDLKKSSSALYMYIGICDMLLEHLKDDLITLYKAKNAHKELKEAQNKQLYDQQRYKSRKEPEKQTLVEQ